MLLQPYSYLVVLKDDAVADVKVESAASPVDSVVS